MSNPGFHVVLIEPEIPQNTGTIGRMCLATGSTLHLVKPLGFGMEEKDLRRAGLDYWKHLSVVVHESAEDFFKTLPETAPRLFIETHLGPTIYETKILPGSYLIFGKETKGLSHSILNKNEGFLAKIPMFDDRVRSLNLSNAVSIVVYEGIRQNNFG